MKHVAILAGVLLSLGASYRTQNFIVSAPTPESAEQLATDAERFRRQLAVDWLGTQLPDWDEPCPITVEIGERLKPAGETSFSFRRGQPVRWRMFIRGPYASLRESVLPHEITHTIFATHFGRPLPRWAEEGACVTVEHLRERRELEDILPRGLSDRRRLELRQMFAISEYPADVMAFYAQGYSLVRFLLERGGRRRFVEFLDDGMSADDWSDATAKHYGYNSLASLQNDWLAWADPK